MATQAEIEAVLREAGIEPPQPGATVQAQQPARPQPAQPQAAQPTQAAPRQRSRTDIGPFGLGTIPPEAKQRVEPESQPRPFPSRAEITADLYEGAPLADRLAAAFKFDPQGMENYLKEQYGASNVFRGTIDDELYFLPPDQLAIPEKDRTFVRFNPVGFDVGDIVEFVPAGVAALGGVGAAYLSGGQSIPITLGALGLGGAAGEGAVQAVGAALPGDEPTATPGARAARIGASGVLEAGGGVVGEVVQRAVPTMLRQGNDLAKRGVQRAVRSGINPERIAAREQLGRRVGQEFTEGQLSGSNAALITERMLRQFVGTADMAAKVDTRQLAALGNNAAEQVARLSTEGGEGGAEAAIRSFEQYIESLVDARSKTAGPLFDKARSIVGNERVIPLNRTQEVIDELIEDYSGDVTSSQSEKIAEFLTRKKRQFDPNGASISSMQNNLREWGKAAAKGRDVIKEVKDPALERRISKKIFGALQDDLENASNLILRRGETGRFESAAQVREAAEALQNARTVFRELSEPINNISENPLGEFIGKDPERLVGQFLNSGRDLTKVRSMMKFLDETAPRQADELRGSVVHEMIRKARRGSEDNPISPAKLVSIANGNERRLNVLFGGNDKARSSYKDMIESARILADQGRLQGAQTLPLQQVQKLISLVGAPAIAGSAFLGADLSEAGEETALVLGALMGSRWLARSMFHPPAAKAYSKIFTAARKPRLSPGAKKAVRQAIVDIVNYNERLETTDRDPRERPQTVEVRGP